MIIDPFLPQFGAFLFVFAIVLGLLTTAKVFENKKVNAAIAIAFGIFSMAYEPFVTGVQTYMPLAAAILVIIFFFVLLKKLFGGDDRTGKFDALPIMIALICLMLVLISQWNLVSRYLPAGVDVNNVGWGIGIAVVLLVIWYAYKHSPPKVSV